MQKENNFSEAYIQRDRFQHTFHSMYRYISGQNVVSRNHSLKRDTDDHTTPTLKAFPCQTDTNLYNLQVHSSAHIHKISRSSSSWQDETWRQRSCWSVLGWLIDLLRCEFGLIDFTTRSGSGIASGLLRSGRSSLLAHLLVSFMAQLLGASLPALATSCTSASQPCKKLLNSLLQKRYRRNLIYDIKCFFCNHTSDYTHFHIHKENFRRFLKSKGDRISSL